MPAATSTTSGPAPEVTCAADVAAHGTTRSRAWGLRAPTAVPVAGASEPFVSAVAWWPGSQEWDQEAGYLAAINSTGLLRVLQLA